MCTHEGSRLGFSVTELKDSLHNSVIKPGLAIKGTEARNSDERIKK